MNTGLSYIAELITQARAARGMSVEALANETGVSKRTLDQLGLGKVNPQRLTLEKVENYFGWDAGLLTRIIGSDTPWNIASIDDLVGELPEAKLSDEALLWEVTHRLQTKDQQIEELQEKVAALEAELKHHRDK